MGARSRSSALTASAREPSRSWSGCGRRLSLRRRTRISLRASRKIRVVGKPLSSSLRWASGKSLRNPRSRISAAMATRSMFSPPWAVSSAKARMSFAGRLSTQKKPASSRAFIASVFPDPESPVMKTNRAPLRSGMAKNPEERKGAKGQGRKEDTRNSWRLCAFASLCAFAFFWSSSGVDEPEVSVRTPVEHVGAFVHRVAEDEELGPLVLEGEDRLFDAQGFDQEAAALDDPRSAVGRTSVGGDDVEGSLGFGAFHPAALSIDPFLLFLLRLPHDLLERLLDRSLEIVGAFLGREIQLAPAVDVDFGDLPMPFREERHMDVGDPDDVLLELRHPRIDEGFERFGDLDMSPGNLDHHGRSLNPGLHSRREGAAVQVLPLVGRRDAQLFAVLRDGAAREDQTLLLENPHDLGIRKRPLGVLLPHDLPDALFDGDGGHMLSADARNPAVEEVSHLVHPLRSVHILVADDSGDRRFVHPDVGRHVAKHHGPQVLDAVLQELVLLADDAVGDFVDGLLALIHRFDQPEGAPELFLDVVARGRVVFGLVLEHPLVHRADPELRETVFIQDHLVLSIDLEHVNVGGDVVALDR